MSPVLADADFQALRRYLRQTAGLEFDDSRRTSLDPRDDRAASGERRRGHVCRTSRCSTGRPAPPSGSCCSTASPSRRRSSTGPARRSTRCATTCCRTSCAARRATGPQGHRLERGLQHRRGGLHPRDARARGRGRGWPIAPPVRVVGTDVSTARPRGRPAGALRAAARSTSPSPARSPAGCGPTDDGTLRRPRRGARARRVRAPQPGHRPGPVRARHGRPRGVPQRHHLLLPRDDPAPSSALPRRPRRARAGCSWARRRRCGS